MVIIANYYFMLLEGLGSLFNGIISNAELLNQKLATKLEFHFRLRLLLC